MNRNSHVKDWFMEGGQISGRIGKRSAGQDHVDKIKAERCP